MTNRLSVTKTHKLLIGGAFVRSESGRSIETTDASGMPAHLCQASRKDLRNAVEAARGAFGGWSGRTAYNRAQILYRLAEMMEGRADELRAATIEKAPATRAPAKRTAKKSSKKKTSKKTIARRTPAPKVHEFDEVELAIDRLVAFAGWADKYEQVIGGKNPVAGPFYNFTSPEPTGVTMVVAPDTPPLLGLVSLIAPALCCGCTVVALASEASPIPACLLGELCETSDVPAGVLNILTGFRAELVHHISVHRDIDAVLAANLDEESGAMLRSGAGENLKRVTVKKLTPRQWRDPDECETPALIERVVEMKTIWHPMAT